METSVRGPSLMIRFSDIIVKSKKFVERCDNDGEASREKLRKQHEEAKAVIEASAMKQARAIRQRAREQQRRALDKMAEDAKSNLDYNHSAMTEIVNLCGGSRMARDRSLFTKLGLVLRTDDECEDDFHLEEAPPSPNHDDDDVEEGEIV